MGTNDKVRSSRKAYSSSFFESYKKTSRNSAEAVAAIMMELVGPASVIDFGCGIGTWLSVFSKMNVKTIKGVDGDHVDRSKLLISGEDFIAANLDLPVTVGGSYDLAMSVEVGEHLKKESAKPFVDTLCSVAPVVMFGAAIPFQGGECHINEQWPTYWAEMFAQNGYTAVDCIRKRVWNDPSVAYYYAQNTLVYVDANRIDDYPLLKEELRTTDPRMFSLVHPTKWEEANGPKGMPLGRLFKILPATLVRTVGARAVELLPAGLGQSVRKLYKKDGR